MPSSPPADLVASLRTAGCVFAEAEAAVLYESAASTAELERMLARRIRGVPLEQIVGWAEFAGTRVAVEPGVFVPRRRSELLVREAVAAVGADGIVLDMCCGSGAIGAAIAAEVAGCTLYAVDVEPAAVRCARRNVAAVNGYVYEGDLYAALPTSLRGRIGVIVANAPYVPSDAVALMPREARQYEPRVALDGGADGTAVQQRVIHDAGSWLAPGGRLLVETSEQQAPRTLEAFTAGGFDTRIARCEDLDATIVVGWANRDAGRLRSCAVPAGQ